MNYWPPVKQNQFLWKIGLFLFAITLTLGTYAAPGFAGNTDQTNKATLTLQLENDFLGSDQWFTHGSYASYVSEPRRDGFFNIAKKTYETLSKQTIKEARYTLAIGQNIYTPANLSATALQANDRPYAGWTYLGLGLMAKKADKKGRTKWVDNYEINLGLVGPDSGAEWVQTEWHNKFDLITPRGWDNQIKNEPTLNLFFEQRYIPKRFRDPLKNPKRVGPLEFDFSPRWGVALGNVFTHASAGATFRLGQNLAEDGVPLLRPSLPGSGHFNPAAPFNWYVFAGFELRAVARNIFLDGNSFRDSHSIDKRWFVADLQIGVAMTYGRARLAMTNILRSEEFIGQNEPFDFRALTLSWSL